MDEHPRKDKWERKPAIDLWSIPHVLFGMLMGAVPGLTGISPVAGIAITAALAVLWEVGERVLSIHEARLNAFMDVVFALMAASLVMLALAAYPIEWTTLAVLTGAVFLVYMYTNISGWLAYRRRHKDFRR